MLHRTLCYIILAVFFLFCENPATKAPSAETQGTSSPKPPSSRLFGSQSKVFFGTVKGINCWANLRENTKEGALFTLVDGRAVFNFRIIIQNNAEFPIAVSAKEPTLQLTGSSVPQSVFEGEKFRGGYVLFGPTVIELNGQDISTQRLSNVKLRPGQYAALDFSFISPEHYKITEAAAMVRSLSVYSATPHGELEIVTK
jgi:hypothetical protein